MRQAGQRVFKRVSALIVLPRDGKQQRIVGKAKPGMCLGEAQIDRWLEQVAHMLEKKYPHWDFKLVETGPNSFSFVYAGIRENFMGVPASCRKENSTATQADPPTEAAETTAPRAASESAGQPSEA